VACDARCVRPTSASHHIHYEYPRLARSRAVQRLGEIGVSRRRDSLRRARVPALRGVFFPVSCLGLRLWCSCRVSPPPGPLLPERRASSKRLDRLATCLVKSPWRPRPGAPSIERWRAPHAARAIVSDPRVTELVCCRSRDFAITIRRSALLRSHLLTAEAFRPASAHACSLGPVDGNRCSVRKGSIPRFSEPGTACRLLQRLRRASTPKRAFGPHPRGRPRSPPRCATEVLRSVKSRASATEVTMARVESS